MYLRSSAVFDPRGNEPNIDFVTTALIGKDALWQCEEDKNSAKKYFTDVEKLQKRL